MAFGFVYRVSISPADVGARVSVRRRLTSGEMSDAVGELLQWADGRLAVRRRDGTVTEIAEDTLVAAKKVPPPPRAAGGLGEIRELQRIAALGWPALDIATSGGWLLRASGGWTLRANSVLALSSPGLPLDEAFEFVESWYAERGLAAAFSVPGPIGGDLDQELDGRGYAPAGREILVLQAAIDAIPAPPDRPTVKLAAAPSAGWLGCYRTRERDGQGYVPPEGVRVLTGNRSATFAHIEADGTVLAIGRATLDRRWLGISAVETAPAARRRGLARHLVCSLAAHGRTIGAQRVYLQVAADNSAALALYRELNLTLHHSYHYRTRSLPEPVPA